MRESQKLELKAANFNTLASNEFVSVTYAQKKYLGWKDRDILANREFMRKDAEFQWEIAQIQAAGPMWKEQLAAAADAAGAEGAEGGEMGAAGGEGGIPEFGGGPAGGEEAAGEDAPVDDVPADTPAPEAAPE
jgi:hypothetical protein